MIDTTKDTLLVCGPPSMAKHALNATIGKCANCGAEVAIAPSGWEIIRVHGAKPACFICTKSLQEQHQRDTGRGFKDPPFITAAQKAELLRAGIAVPSTFKNFESNPQPEQPEKGN